jgi:KTSC domain
VSKPYKPPQAFDEGEPLPITMTPVESNQVKAIGYDAATKTLAVTFNFVKALYQYPNVEQATFDAFRASDSAGKFFSQHIKDLPFKKFHADAVPA